MKPENAAAFIKTFIPPPGRSCREAKALLKMMQSSLLDTALIQGKPLEIPFYLEPDGLERLACLKVEHGPALLALCRPEDIVQALGVLGMHFGMITYQDGRTGFPVAIEIVKK